MSYAIRKDGQGWRAVSGPADIGEDEIFASEAPGPIVVPNIDLLQIDNAADAAYTRIAGSAGRVAEYERAYAEAAAFKEAGYSGLVGQAVTSWAQAKGWTNQQAADDIIAAKTAFDGALYAIRDLRLKGKEAVRNAGTAEAKSAVAGGVVAQLNAVGVTA